LPETNLRTANIILLKPVILRRSAIPQNRKINKYINFTNLANFNIIMNYIAPKFLFSKKSRHCHLSNFSQTSLLLMLPLFVVCIFLAFLKRQWLASQSRGSVSSCGCVGRIRGTPRHPQLTEPTQSIHPPRSSLLLSLNIPSSLCAPRHYFSQVSKK